MEDAQQVEEYYDQAVKELKERFDKPREMHRMYLHNVINMASVKSSQASLTEFADTLRESWDGLIRLKQTDASFVLTSLSVGFLPDKIRMAWEEKTETSKTVPSVEELIAFVRRKADNPLYAEKSTGSSYPTDKKPHKQQQAKHKGSAHVAVSQPAKAPVQQPTPQPTVSQSNQTPASRRGATPRSKNTSYPPCRYTCPSCSENHYAFSCSTFRSMAVPQRKGHVRVNTLCSTCLKPGHVPADCRSKFTCQVCFGSHNSLLHSDPSTGNPPSASGTVNLTSTIANETLDKSKLLMTCQVLVTGPTGKSMPVTAGQWC